MAMYWAFSPRLLKVWGGAMTFRELNEPGALPAPFCMHTETEAVAIRPPLPACALIVVVPQSPAGATNPVELTVATAGILADQTTWSVMSS
jgi:hypothetical protein